MGSTSKKAAIFLTRFAREGARFIEHAKGGRWKHPLSTDR